MATFEVSFRSGTFRLSHRGRHCVVVSALGCLLLGASNPLEPVRSPEGTVPTVTGHFAPKPGKTPNPKTADTLKYLPLCGQPQFHDACDLEAQWKAANAARDAADWSWYQMVFSALGLAGLLYSLVLTRRATNVAVEATRDADKALQIAERNAIAAAEQVIVAKETALLQLRPYVYFCGADLVRNNEGETGFRVSYKNYGQTPATSLSIRSDIQSGNMPFIGLAEPKPLSSVRAEIAPGETAATIIWVAEPRFDQIKGSFAKRITLEMRYSYSQGREALTTIEMVCDHRTMRDGKLFLLKPDGTI